MTDQEYKPQNWVAERARCTLASKFEELVEAVRTDVEEINRQVSSVRHGQLFSVEEMEHCTCVRRSPERNPRDTSGSVHFTLSRKAITVHLPGELAFDVLPKWNETHLRCELFIDDELHDLWQISQKALGDFFFDGE